MVVETAHSSPPQEGITRPDIHNVVPEGTFFAGEYTPQRLAAIRKAVALGRRLAASHPEVADLYREMNPSPTRYIDIARRVIPPMAQDSPEIASRAVGYAVRRLIPPDEQAQLTAAHRGRHLRQRMAKLTPAQLTDHQRTAAARRHEIHGVDTQVMIRARGRTPWGEEERELVLQLLVNDPEYKHTSGSIEGTPNHQKIADLLNEIFHDDKPVRYANSVASLIRDARRKK